MHDDSTSTIYLDYNATSPPLPSALRAALPFLTDSWGNPASAHAVGRRAFAALEEAREQVAEWAGGRPAEVVFTSGATEANHLALKGVREPEGGERRGVLVSAVEHPSILGPARVCGAGVLPVDSQGVLDLKALEDALIAHRPILVSVMAANNETGVLQPIPEIARRVREHGGFLHVDATQLPGRLGAPEEWDLLTLSGHKSGGLKGAGALVIRSGVPLEPQLVGGSQERSRRAGTVNVAACVAMGVAVGAPVSRDLSGFASPLLEAARAIGAEITGGGAARLANTLHLHLDMPGEAIATALDLEGVCISTGTTCASGASQASHVMEAMGLDGGKGVRFSWGWKTSMEDMERAAGLLVDVVSRYREISEWMEQP